MTDRPILFSGPMVSAILREIDHPGIGKTQTRRVLGAVPDAPNAKNVVHPNARHTAPYLDAYCGGKKSHANPRGATNWWCWWTRDDRPCEQFNVGYAPGDRLWVRETWKLVHVGGGRGGGMQPFNCYESRYRADDHMDYFEYDGDDDPFRVFVSDTWRPSIFMPRWASRITLTVTDVRVQRLHEITEVDAIAEGAPKLVIDDDGKFYESDTGNHRTGFAGLWNHLNDKRGFGWDRNPWVVAITFLPELSGATLSTQRQPEPAAWTEGDW